MNLPAETSAILGQGSVIVPERGRRDYVPIFGTEETRSKMEAKYEDGLRHWPASRDAFFVPTRYGRTHVVAIGKTTSPPLVMLHPMGAASFGWHWIIGALSSKHRVYCLDTIGDVGRSELDDPEWYPTTGHDYSGWLDDVYRELGITTPDVVGGSMGGWIAMNHAMYARDRINRLVLLGPMGLPSWRTTFGILGPMMSYVIRPTQAKLDKLITRSLGEGERVNHEYRDWMRLLGKCEPKVGQPFHIPGRKLRRIHAPTLIFLGEKDGLIGNAAAAARRARRHIAGCQIEILPNAGHIMYVDEPTIVGRRVARFLDARAPS